MSKIEKVKIVLAENDLQGIQAFDCRNIAGDIMETIYEDEEIQIDHCSGYNYIEIFGLSQEEMECLADEGYIS